MFDEHAQRLIDTLPLLPGLDPVECRRALSATYYHVIQARLSARDTLASQEDRQRRERLLRRLVQTLESIAVFDPLNGVSTPGQVVTSSAFVGGEALALLDMLSPASEGDFDSTDPIQNPRIYAAIESALLYMVGGYDINATSVVRDIVPHHRVEAVDMASARTVNAWHLIGRIRALCRGDVLRPTGSVAASGLAEAPELCEDLIDEVRVRLYGALSGAVDAYIDWLGGYNDSGGEEAVAALDRIRTACVPTDNPMNTMFSDVHHLSSLLMAAISRTSSRSLVHNVPPPTGGDQAYLVSFFEYLRHRARGDDQQLGRPYLWPSTIEYVAECLPGPRKDAAVAMPTGSGKSFLAELAVTHALGSGWVLYLAPTNALVSQIRRDLRNSLSDFADVNILAFVGSEEYTTLSEEQIAESRARFVAVMTPEKCALALRLYPERFETCSLCVFDECHLLRDDHRGITADVIVAQLLNSSWNIRFLLMSAMIGNPEELAQWLGSARNGESSPISVKWKPSRTLRGLLALDKGAFDESYGQARIEATTPGRKAVEFGGTLALVAGLSGPWTDGQPDDYQITCLPVAFPFRLPRGAASARGPQYDSWKNSASRLLSEHFARSGIPVINFTLASRHHPFSLANKVTSDIPGSVGARGDLDSLTTGWLSIADAELGVRTVLWDLLRKGVSVHTSAMLEAEQIASELMFKSQHAKLMFASPTLAQGLNLPALAVVVAGTSMGDPRQDSEVDASDGVSRAEEAILNGFGRAGRPGFANQGIAVLVSDEPYSVSTDAPFDPQYALSAYGVLQQPDAASRIHSPVEAFLDQMLAGSISGLSLGELQLVSLLAEFKSDQNHSGELLSRTFAAFHKRELLSPDAVDLLRRTIANLEHQFLEQPGVPSWMNKAAMRSGVDFFRALRIWQAYVERGLVDGQTAIGLDVTDWLDILFEILAALPPYRVSSYLEDDGVKSETVLTKLRDGVRRQEFIDDAMWSAPENWSDSWQELKQLVLLYMRGASYSAIAQAYRGLQPSEVTSGRAGTNPIPSVFRFVRRVIHPLAVDAGCLLALQELYMEDAASEPRLVPEALQGLPLCVRNGCRSLEVLAWYRFGFRQRVCAHALASAFPMPEDLQDDSARARWVRGTRRDWLRGALTLNEADHPILTWAKTVITDDAGL